MRRIRDRAAAHLDSELTARVAVVELLSSPLRISVPAGS